MAFQAFQTIVISELRARMGDCYRFTVHKIPKNNGRVLNGLCILQEGENTTPTIYLESFFHRYRQGESLENLINEIIQTYGQHRTLVQQEFSHLLDLDYLKDKIIYRLIHTQSNPELLKDRPSLPCHDLSIVFYLFLDQNDHCSMTSPVTNYQMDHWKLTPEELYRIASINTPHLFPPCLHAMDQVIGHLIRSTEGSSSTDSQSTEFPDLPDTPSLYILTNDTGTYGASVLLYPNILRNFAQLLGRDLVILPSSIHEVLLLPYEDGQDLSDMCSMVTFINQTEVPLEDQLSNHVYLYSRETDSVQMIQGSVPSILS